jgi:hypothetical protein
MTAAIVYWSTVYLDRAVRQLRGPGTTVPDDLLAHVASLGWGHIELTGDYVWTAPDPAIHGGIERAALGILQPGLIGGRSFRTSIRLAYSCCLGRCSTFGACYAGELA